MTDVCETCGLPDELCVCEDVAKGQNKISIKTEERSYGKEVTIAENFNTDNIDIEDLSSELKSKLACGGTVDNDRIELQGDHKSRLRNILENRGYELE